MVIYVPRETSLTRNLDFSLFSFFLGGTRNEYFHPPEEEEEEDKAAHMECEPTVAYNFVDCESTVAYK